MASCAPCGENSVDQAPTGAGRVSRNFAWLVATAMLSACGSPAARGGPSLTQGTRPEHIQPTVRSPLVSLRLSLGSDAMDVVFYDGVGLADYGIRGAECSTDADSGSVEFVQPIVFYDEDSARVSYPPPEPPMASLRLETGGEFSLHCDLVGVGDPWEFDVNRETLGLDPDEDWLCAEGDGVSYWPDSAECLYGIGEMGAEPGRAVVTVILIIVRES